MFSLLCPARQIGDVGTLTLGGYPTPSRFSVRARGDGMLHVAFELSEADRTAYRNWLAQRVGGGLVKAS